MEVRYLKDNSLSRSLYEEAFREDSRSFVDYYYSERIKKLKVLSVIGDNGDIDAMMHLNPYVVCVDDELWVIDYLCAISTKTEFRHRGYMDMLFERYLNDSFEKKNPFVYLVPVNPDIYTHLGFSYVFDKPYLTLNSDKPLNSIKLTELTDSKKREDLYSGAAIWCQNYLKAHYRVFTKREREYIANLTEEMRCDGGSVELLYDEDTLVGIMADDLSDGNGQRMMYTDNGYSVRISGHPYAMARIVYLRSFVRKIHLKPTVPVDCLDIVIDISDPQISANNATWKWRLGREKSSWQISHAETPDIALTIGEFTGWLFGYFIPEQARKFAPYIETLSDVFLDELI